MTAFDDRPLLHVVSPRQEGLGWRGPVKYRQMTLVVLAALAAREGWRVEIVDEEFMAIPDEPPDLVALTAWTMRAPRAYDMADRYREMGVPIVIGGVHASLMPQEAERHVDAVMVGECEATFAEVLRDASSGQLRPRYLGHWGEMDEVPSVEEYADFYMAGPYQKMPVHMFQTTRGCRFNCDFCSVIRINGRSPRHLPVDRTIHELETLARLNNRPGPLPLFITDDDLSADPNYARELLEAIVRSGLKLNWSVQTSVGLARDDELLDLAARSGLQHVYIGFESVSRGALVEANKKNRPHEFHDLVTRIQKRKISVSGGFIFGFDDDRPDVFEHTADFVHGLGVDFAYFGLLTPFPGTQTFARMYGEGRLRDLNWAHYDTSHAVYEPANMRRDELRQGLSTAISRFYTWRRCASRLSRMPFRRNPGQILGSVMNYRIYSTGKWAEGYRTPPDFEARDEDLRLLLTTSEAPAAEAVKVAFRQVSTPVGLSSEARPAEPS